MLITFSILFVWIFWGLYALIMSLYRAQLNKELTVTMKILGFPYLLSGYLIDIVCNLTLACIIFLELPRELLVTTRLIRHINSKTGWRCKISNWICTNLLDPLDPRGKHCK